MWAACSGGRATRNPGIAPKVQPPRGGSGQRQSRRLMHESKPMHDSYDDFLDGFADTIGMDHAKASEQWAGFSRQLTRADREQIEAGGYAAGEEQGKAFLQLYAL